MKIKIACVQLNPKLGQVERNIVRARQLLAQLKDEVDLIVFPELALTGYKFESRQAIEPFLEPTSAGVSAQFAADVLRQHRCFTVIGYPERALDSARSGVIYNSALLTNPVGRVVHNYRKTFLYEADEDFGCTENPSRTFEPVEVILDKRYYLADPPALPEVSAGFKRTTVNFGICMDLNPYKFEAPFNKFEFSLASFARRATLIVCPMAWLSPASPSLTDETADEKARAAHVIHERFFAHEEAPTVDLDPSARRFTPEDAEAHERLGRPFVPSQPEYLTVNYWILRFFPFLNHPHNELPKHYSNVAVVACNRTGLESDVLYAGSSSIIQFRNVPGNSHITTRNPSVSVEGALGQGAEGILVRDVELD